MNHVNRTKDLNEKSSRLTAEEMAVVDRFSVLLPMGDLPEIVVSSQDETGKPADSRKPDALRDPADLPRSGPQPSATRESADASSGNHHERTDPGSATDRDSVSLPTDELSLFDKDDPAPRLDGDNEVEHESESDDDYVFPIDTVGTVEEKVERIAKNLEARINERADCIICLTAPLPVSGRDDVFHSLAVSLARRNPTQQIACLQLAAPENETDNTIGFGHVLDGEYELQDVVVPTSIDNIDYLGYSPHKSTSGEVDSGLARILRVLKKHYDLVLVHCPPVEESDSGDVASDKPFSVIRMADLVYLLLSLGTVERNQALQFTGRLRQAGATLAGCILTEYQRMAS